MTRRVNFRVMRLMDEFERQPAEYMHPSRRDMFCPMPAMEAVWDSARARRHLSRNILRTLSLDPCDRSAEVPWPVALLDTDRLQRIALCVAAAAASAQVRGCLLRDEVLLWREWLSSDAFSFSQETARLLPELPHVRIDRGVPAPSFGLRLLARAALAWPVAIAGRFLLKMPRDDAEHACDVDPTLVSRLAVRVLSIVEPRWCSSLATTSP
jgi:hypothetical protein